MKTFAVLFALVAVAGMGCGDRNTVAPDPPIAPETSDALRPVGNRAVFIPVSGISTTVETIDPGTQWIDDDGVLHMRGRILRQVVTGQDENGVPYGGDGLTKFDVNLDLATGNGNFHGRRYDTVYYYGDLQGPFEGVMDATITEWDWIALLNYHGSGDFEGWKFRGPATNTWGSGLPTPFEGFLHNPRGN